MGITLPDGKEVSAESWRTTPYDVALGISKGLADNCVVAKVNGDLWDLDRPLEQDANLELVKFDDDSNTMNKKVRNAQIAQYNFIFVVGEKERSNKTVNVRRVRVNRRVQRL